MSFKVEPVSTESLDFGESPLWDNRINKLVCIDCFKKAVVQFDPKTKQLIKKITTTSEEIPYLSVAVPFATQDDSSSPNYLVAAADKLFEFNWETEELKTVYESQSTRTDGKKRYFHDGKCDLNGRLWIGSLIFNDMGTLDMENGQGEIHRVETIGNELKKTTHAAGYDIPNGLAWNKEYTKLYHVDLLKRVINVYDFEKDKGQLENGRVFFDFASVKDLKGSPDGMVTDFSGNLWVACWKGSAVIKIDGTTGQLLETVNLPVENVTSACFGGENYESLFVTTTSIELDKSVVEGQPDAGKIFQITNHEDNTFKGFQHCFFKN